MINVLLIKKFFNGKIRMTEIQKKKLKQSLNWQDYLILSPISRWRLKPLMFGPNQIRRFHTNAPHLWLALRWWVLLYSGSLCHLRRSSFLFIVNENRLNWKWMSNPYLPSFHMRRVTCLFSTSLISFTWRSWSLFAANLMRDWVETWRECLQSNLVKFSQRDKCSNDVSVMSFEWLKSRVTRLVTVFAGLVLSWAIPKNEMKDSSQEFENKISVDLKKGIYIQNKLSNIDHN